MSTPHRGADAPFGLVVNPTSALGRGRRVAERVRRRLEATGVHAVVISGGDAGDCSARIAAAARDGLRGLILVGGDGLLGLALQLAEVRELPLGIVPAGSGNDFARQFRLPGRPRAALARILSAIESPRPVDLGVVTRPDPERPGEVATTWFAGGLSVGFDAAINRRANDLRLPLGPLRYQLALLGEIVALRPRRFSVDVDPVPGAATKHGPGGIRRTREFAGLLATVMNIGSLGGGIPIAPDADASDGQLDLVEVIAVTRPRLLSVLGVLARGRHGALPEVRFTRGTGFTIDAPGEVAYADGERVGSGPFRVTVAPGALRLLA
ncbi:diacylglycerol/lipid kinase family protein [Leucobacter luti]|uniref:diacylglycerol/lipid kinase family protein n=1 Tax=Leucobacter luti TaxID=340320 RepID=UPI003D0418B6